MVVTQRGFVPRAMYLVSFGDRRAEFASDSLLEGTGFEPSVPGI
jgi:hypothetical protein